MGGGQSASGSSNQYTSGDFWNTSTQTPRLPPELQTIQGQTASHLANVQNMAPLEGQYGSYMVNPAYTEWEQKYGQYNAPPGGQYYTSLSNPNQILYKLLKGNTGVEGYYTSPEIGPGGMPMGQEVPISDVNMQLLNIPYTPEQYIPDPSTMVPGSSYLEAQPQQIAPMSALESQAAALTPDVLNTPLAELMALDYAGQAGGVPTNAPYYAPGAFEASPYYQTAQGAFESGVAPMIENQMALSGLGRSSSLADSLGLGWSSMLPAVLSQYSTQYVEPQLGREENALSRMAALVPALTNLGGQETNRMLQGIQAMMSAGGLGRGIEQASLDAIYKDMLRRQALSEEALYTPMGMLFPSAIGQDLISTGQYSSNTLGSTSQSTSGGGLFK